MRGDQNAPLSCARAHIGCERMRGPRGLRVISIFPILLVCILNLAWAAPLRSQGPPRPPAPRGLPGPPRLDARAVDDHIQNVQRHLEEIKPKDQDCEMLIAVARRNLDKAEEKAHANDLFVADRLVAASDAFIHAAEHPLHLEEGPKGPRPDAEEVEDSSTKRCALTESNRHDAPAPSLCDVGITSEVTGAGRSCPGCAPAPVA